MPRKPRTKFPVVSGSPPTPPIDASSSEAEFQERKQLDVDLLPINKRIRNVRMSLETPEELIDSNRTEMPKKTRQKEWFRIHEPDHGHRLDVVAPHHRIACGSPVKALLANGKLPIVDIYCGIGVEQLRSIYRGDGTRRHFRKGYDVGLSDNIANRIRICGSRGRMLIFCTDVDD